MRKIICTAVAAIALCFVYFFFARVTAQACGPDNYPSVHFNTEQPDFGAPPRTLSIYPWKEAETRPLGCTSRADRTNNADWKQQQHWEEVGNEALQNARRLEAAGQLEEAMPHYRNALKHNVETPGERDKLKYGADIPAAIMDRQELLDELNHDTDRTMLNEYLSARRDYDFARPGLGEAQMTALANNPQAGILRAHALYVLGAIQYDKKHPEQAATIFENLVKLYPQSRRREAALIMIPRSLLQVPSSEASIRQWVGNSLPAGNAFARSRAALQTLLHGYPHSRFHHYALSWLARCDYLQGQRVTALESYLHQYATFTTKEDRVSAAASVLFVSAELTSLEAKQLRADLHRNAEILGDYLEYRLEHASASEHDRVQLLDLATEADNHQLHLQAQSAARLAEAFYLSKRYRDAITWSNCALSSLPGSGKVLALYVRGASYRKSKQGAAAEADFKQLLHQYATSYLCGAVRENLALLYERSGRPGLALDQYFTLGYKEDIAYLLDARMTTHEVADYLNTHPRHPQHDLLLYTLGIRQLRDNQLVATRATLSLLPEKSLLAMMAPKDVADWKQHDQLRDPRKTAHELAQLEQAIAQAHEPNAKSEAQYAKASYLYNNRDLLFYNYALWQGGRSRAFSLLWNVNATAPVDLTATRQHHHEHECLYRTRALCLDIALQYPQSPTAAKALYRAACASNALAHFDDWWRKEALQLHLSNDAVLLMKRVYQQYPLDPLAGPARKFARVFAEEHAEIVRNTMFVIAKK